MCIRVYYKAMIYFIALQWNLLRKVRKYILKRFPLRTHMVRNTYNDDEDLQYYEYIN